MKYLLILLLCAQVHAIDFSLERGLITTHIGGEHGAYNESNGFVGVRINGIEATTFINSYNVRAFTLGTYSPFDFPLGASIGFVKGYRKDRDEMKIFDAFYINNDTTFGISPYLQHTGIREVGKNYTVGVRLRYFGTNALNLSLYFDYND